MPLRGPCMWRSVSISCNLRHFQLASAATWVYFNDFRHQDFIPGTAAALARSSARSLRCCCRSLAIASGNCKSWYGQGVARRQSELMELLGCSLQAAPMQSAVSPAGRASVRYHSPVVDFLCVYHVFQLELIACDLLLSCQAAQRYQLFCWHASSSSAILLSA